MNIETGTCKDCGLSIVHVAEKALNGKTAVVWTDGFGSWICDVTHNEHVPGDELCGSCGHDEMDHEARTGQCTHAECWCTQWTHKDETWKVTYSEKPEWWDDPTEPRCDVCGVHTEEADDWCGDCGNCGEHCECPKMPPAEALTYAILAINTDQAPDATSGNDLLYLELNAERALAALDRLRDFVIASGEDLPGYVFGKDES